MNHLLETVREWANRLLGVVWRNPSDQELERELDSHLELAEEELRRRGHTRAEAARLARARFGLPAKAMEQLRDQRGIPWLTGFSLDATLGLRILRKHWGLTLVAGLAMALPIALAVVIFAFYEAAVWRPPPLPNGDRLVALQSWDPARSIRRDTPVADYEHWRDALRSVQNVSAFRTVERNVTDRDGVPGKPVLIAEVTASAFAAAGVQPLLGRTLSVEDERNPEAAAVVIGYALWQSEFGGDPAVLGQTLRIGEKVHTVVGVMPRDFTFPINHHVWTPLNVRDIEVVPPAPRGAVFGQLAAGFELEQADAELEATGMLPPTTDPESREQIRPRVVPYTFAFTDDVEPEQMQMQIRLVLLFTTLLLIPPSGNAAILVYARNVSRREEFAGRCALGATRRRIVVQLFVEALILASLAAGLALLLARLVLGFANRGLEESMGGTAPFWMSFGLSAGTLLLAAGLAVVAAGIAGLVPAIQGTRRLTQSGLRVAGGSSGLRLGSMWSVLVVAQVALAFAGLPSVIELAWGGLRPGILGPGFAAERFLTAQLTLDATALDQGGDLAARFSARRTELMRRLRAEPGVEAVTSSSAVPNEAPWARVEVVSSNAGSTTPAVPVFGELPARTLRAVRSLRIDEAFFDTYEIEMLSGRPLNAEDFDSARNVVITENLAKELTGDASPLGLRFRYFISEPATGDRAVAGPEFEVVGVATELFASSDWGSVYHAAQIEELYPASISIRSTRDSSSIADRVRELAAEIDWNLRVHSVRTVEDAYRDQQIGNYAGISVLGAVTLSVVLLSLAGMYALMSFIVNQHRRDIAIRSALGAQARSLLAAVFRRAFVQVGAGAALGAFVALALARYLPVEQMGGRNVPGVLPGAAAFMILIAALAVLGPARRALRIEPTEALRD